MKSQDHNSHTLDREIITNSGLLEKQKEEVSYHASRSPDFDGIATKRFLLGQAREQIAWYRQSIDAIDFVGSVACRRALESGQPFLEHYLPAYNFRETDRGTEYKRDPTFPILPAMWSRRDPDKDERFDDAGETPDTGIFDLR